MTTTRSRTPLILGVVLAVVAVVAIVAVVATRGNDGDDEAGGPSTSAGDPAEVVMAPPLAGQDFTGSEVEIVPGEDGPLMVVFLAHWCPHCNAEIPVLQEWEASGDIPEDLTVVGVSTAAQADAPNYPPGEWLEAMGWEWPAIDDEDGSLAETWGVDGFPFIVFVDDAGQVVGTTTGEQPVEALQQLADQATA